MQHVDGLGDEHNLQRYRSKLATSAVFNHFRFLFIFVRGDFVFVLHLQIAIHVLEDNSWRTDCT